MSTPNLLRAEMEKWEKAVDESIEGIKVALEKIKTSKDDEPKEG